MVHSHVNGQGKCNTARRHRPLGSYPNLVNMQVEEDANRYYCVSAVASGLGKAAEYLRGWSKDGGAPGRYEEATGGFATGRYVGVMIEVEESRDVEEWPV
ncbi:predicted protein [Histoplasma capsulatum H143]|uniref:Uncharacterized protein n=1 Tax=Ajellomyces capsulatus (strain H143) TaxID=544712 RepID=C6HL70_AJECH|nr:predicted protein [Histoplasma capsulatum H143]